MVRAGHRARWPRRTSATFPYVLDLAEHGFTGALARRPEFVGGVNTYQGGVTHRAVAEALELPFTLLGLGPGSDGIADRAPIRPVAAAIARR